MLGFPWAPPPGLVKPQRQRRPRGAGIVERRVRLEKVFSSRLRPLRRAAHDRADPILNGNQHLDESAVHLPGPDRAASSCAHSPADDPRPPVAQAKAEMKRPAATWATIPQQLAMRGADTALRQHPLRPQVLVLPGGAIGSKQAQQTGGDREAVGAQGGPCSRTRRLDAPRVDARASSATRAPDRRRRPAPNTRSLLSAARRRRSEFRASRPPRPREGADQASRVEPVAASDPPEPG